MAASGNKGSTQYESIKAWADVVVSMWTDKIIKLDVIDTHELMQSFVAHVKKHAGGNVEKVQHLFRMYGIYQDMGVGRDTPVGNTGDLAWDTGRSEKIRQPKPWYSSVFFREVRKLRDYMAYRYGTKVASHVAGLMSESFDKRYKNPANSRTKTIGSLKTQMYRDKTRERNRRNYYKRELGPNWRQYVKNS